MSLSALLQSLPSSEELTYISQGKRRVSFEGPDGLPYVSAGVLFRTADGSVLLQEVNDKPWAWSDFGGKSCVRDNSLQDLAFRKCLDELQHPLITRQWLESQPSRKSFVPKYKYVMFVIQLPQRIVVKGTRWFSPEELAALPADSVRECVMYGY